MKQSKRIPDTDCIYLKNGDYYCKYMYNDIYLIAASGRNCNIYLSPDKSVKLVISMALNELLNFLPPEIFIRNHRSYVINIHHIERIAGNLLYIGETPLPIGREYKKEVYSLINIAGIPPKE